jgi:tetratricopeptide (TPR) repeat protein
MRIGEILVRAEIVDAKKLADALTYAGYKMIPIGRALRVLRYISEADLNKALAAQAAIRSGFDGQYAIPALRYALANHRSFSESVQAPHTLLGLPERIPNSQLLIATGKPSALPVIGPKGKLEKETQSFEDLVELGDNLFLSNQLDVAEKAYLKAWKQIQDVHGVPPSKTAMVLTKLAHLFFSWDRFKDAQPLYEKVLEIQRSTFGPDSPETTRALEDLGDLYDIQDRFPEAGRYFEQALLSMHQQRVLDVEVAGRMLKKLLVLAKRSGEQNPRARLGELAVDSSLITQDQLQSALQTARETGKPLGAVLRDSKIMDTQQVESLMFAQMLVKQATIPAAVAVRAIKLAAAQKMPLRQLCEAGRWIAERELNDEQRMKLVIEQERLLAAETAYGANSAEAVEIVQKIADMHMERKDRPAAEALYKRAITILQKHPNADKLRLALMSESLAELYMCANKSGDAQTLLLKALEYRQAAGKGESVESAQTLWLIAKVELAQFNHATALSFLRSAKAVYDKAAPGACPRPMLADMANCYIETGLTSELEPLLVELIQKLKSENRQFEMETAHFMEQLGDIYLGSGRHAHAQAQYYAAWQICERSPGNESQAQTLSKKLQQSTNKV